MNENTNLQISTNSAVDMPDDAMRCFFISEFEKELETRGVDTVCFMGYGYDFDDIKVGAEFYFSYFLCCLLILQ